MKNFLRKWGVPPQMDEYSYPVTTHRFNIGLIIKNDYIDRTISFEPLFDTIYTDIDLDKFNDYIAKEQPLTAYDLKSKFKSINDPKKNSIIIYLNGNLIPSNIFQLLIEFKHYLSNYNNTIDLGITYTYKGITCSSYNPFG